MLLILPTMSALSFVLNHDFNMFLEQPMLGLVYECGRVFVALYYFFFISTQLLAALDFLVLITYFNYTN